MGYNIKGVGKSTNGSVSLTNAKFINFVLALAGGITYTLPAVADSEGKIMVIKKTDSNATTITIDGYGSETIDGQAFITITEQYEVARLYCNGSVWYTW